MTAQTEISHAVWQEQVMELAGVLGWTVLHVRKSVGKGAKWTTTTNIKGWPDLWCWHRKHGFAGIELKVGRDKPTPEQLAVLDSLRSAGAAVMVAYPDDWNALESLLRRRPDGPPLP